jgi:homoserine dehydrogenase
MKKNLKIGLFGYGVVGQGVYEILTQNKNFGAEVVKICVKDRKKRRNLPESNFTFEKNDILQNPDIDLIIEVINNADDAFEIITTALKNGKRVVTANKKMLAEHLEELVNLQQEKNVSLLYEGSSCGSIPIIRNLEEYYDNELLYSIRGVFNSSSNYVLSKVYNENIDFDIALKKAQDLGFAETDPTLDLAGYDALFKLVIIAAHAYGVFVKPEEVLNAGIMNFSQFDMQFAKEKGYKIKLLSTVRKVGDDKVAMFVLPEFITEDRQLYNVEYEYNAVVVEAAFSDKQFFQGKGAGGHPTGSAIFSDISANMYDYKYGYKKFHQEHKLTYTTDLLIEIYLRYYDEKNLNHFNFEEITERYYGKDFNYVIGTIKIENLLKIKNILNTSDIQVINTGRLNKIK